MDKLNKKLAEWAGFRKHLDYQGVWIQPDNKEYNDELPNFTHSLDACFKWLVPKLIEYGFSISLYFLNGRGEYDDKVWHAHVGCDDRNIVIYETDKDNPALALCLAIEKLIGQKDSTT